MIENLETCPERAKRVEWIAIVIVLVVQRTEQRFPKGKTAFLLEFADVISRNRLAPSLLRSVYQTVGDLVIALICRAHIERARRDFSAR